MDPKSHSYLVNRFTRPPMMHDLIHLAQKTKRFTIHTQFDHATGRPALIQIEFINEPLSVVVFDRSLTFTQGWTILVVLVDSFLTEMCRAIRSLHHRPNRRIEDRGCSAWISLVV